MSAATDASALRGKVTSPSNANPSLTKAQLASALSDTSIANHSSAMRAEINELIRRGRVVVTDR